MIMAEDEAWKKIEDTGLINCDFDFSEHSDFIDEICSGTSTLTLAEDKNDNLLENNTVESKSTTSIGEKLKADYMRDHPAILSEQKNETLEEESPNIIVEKSVSDLNASQVVSSIVDDLVNKVEEKQFINYRTGIAYDERMCRYRFHGNHPERPARITFIYQKLVDIGLVEKCKLIEPRHATEEELQTRHSLKHISLIQSIKDKTDDELEKLAMDYDSIYFHPAVTDSSFLSAGCTLALMEEILTGTILNGVAVTRPPGHHALNHCSMGFCHFNNVAIAAMVAIEKYKLKRVLIVDWDVHYGNGTHKMFESDPRVLFYSMHRYDNGAFWPCLKEANFNSVGIGAGEGFNIHVAWNNGEMGDPEYLLAFEKILMPVAKEFDPELVIVSAGFDSGAGDPLGGYKITPQGYAHMTHQLMKLAGGKVFLVLEGGYNLHTISESMAACVLTLLNDSVPSLKSEDEASTSATRSVKSTYNAIRKYWTCFKDKEF